MIILDCQACEFDHQFRILNRTMNFLQDGEGHPRVAVATLRVLSTRKNAKINKCGEYTSCGVYYFSFSFSLKSFYTQLILLCEYHSFLCSTLTFPFLVLLD